MSTTIKAYKGMGMEGGVARWYDRTTRKDMPEFRTLAARMNDRAIDAVIELARIDGLVPMLRQTADFNWHRQSALALLKHAQFRKILLSSLWR